MTARLPEVLPDDPTARFLTWLEAFSPEALARAGEVFAQDFLFENPMQSGHGVEWMQKSYARFFEVMDEFELKAEHTMHDERYAYVLFRIRQVMKGKEASVDAIARVEFDASGKVIVWREYWDAAHMVYENIPVVGSLIRLIHGQMLKQVGD
jgi:hypothetical protein